MVDCLNQIRIGGKNLTVMTAFATADNVLMNRAKKVGRSKISGGIVTDTAIIRCRDMINLLRGCDTSVMAGRAIVGIDAHVVKNRAREAVCRVTNKTILDGRYVIR